MLWFFWFSTNLLHKPLSAHFERTTSSVQYLELCEGSEVFLLVFISLSSVHLVL